MTQLLSLELTPESFTTGMNTNNIYSILSSTFFPLAITTRDWVAAGKRVNSFTYEMFYFSEGNLQNVEFCCVPGLSHILFQTTSKMCRCSGSLQRIKDFLMAPVLPRRLLETSLLKFKLCEKKKRFPCFHKYLKYHQNNLRQTSSNTQV